MRLRISRPRRPRMRFWSLEASATSCNSCTTNCGTSNCPSKKPVVSNSSIRPSIMQLVSTTLVAAGLSVPSATSNDSTELGLISCNRERPCMSAKEMPEKANMMLPNTAVIGLINANSEGMGKRNRGASIRFATSNPRINPTDRLSNTSMDMPRMRRSMRR